MRMTTYKGAARKVAAAAAVLAIACATSAPAFGSETIIDRNGGTADTVLTGKVATLDDVISVVLPSNIKMTIKTDKEGHLDEVGTEDVEVDVVNESRSTKAVKLVLYETVDDQGLLDEVRLNMNGQDIKRAVGGASGEISLIERIAPGETDRLTMSADAVGPSQVIHEGARSVKTTVKATVL